MSAFNAKHRVFIPRNRVVSGKERQPLHPRLGKQKPVKWVFVNREKPCDGENMAAFNGKFEVAVLQKPAMKRGRVELKIGAAEGVFNDDFPNTRGAKEQGVVRVGYIRNYHFGQVTGGSPNENVRVQEEFQVLPAKSAVISSRPMVSKSAGQEISPFMNPIRSRTGGVGASFWITSTMSALPVLMLSGRGVSSRKMRRPESISTVCCMAVIGKIYHKGGVSAKLATTLHPHKSIGFQSKSPCRRW